MEHHNPNIFGTVALAGSVGTAGQVLQSAGVGAQAVWGSGLNLYAATDKTSQTIALGPADITWNTPAADAITGITFSSNQFTLPANRLYRIDVFIQPTSALVNYSISIVDSSNNPVGSLNLPATGSGTAHTHATAVYKPLSDTAIKVRLTGAIAITVGSVSHIIIQTMD